ncbi:hypothetical protein [Methylopila turkensis]|uniref:Uncharacterized protein n=1 Tax=Methylopila turkensis TaxID=1437816 RepID=A0A9W6JUL4_9HYPH|nr:hypothetical protein [Methylopila turkensis]GLK81728.1 hypothetical protein GCM10008174_34690 [Methylopila turkensis]
MRSLACLCAAAMFAVAAPAASGAESPRPDRYELKPADGGFLRLDRETGATAFCRAVGEGYDCRAAGATDQPSEIRRLEERVAALEEQVRKLAAGVPTPAEPKAGEPKLVEPGSGPTLRLPTDKEIDQLAETMGRALRRFREFAETLEKNAEPDEQKL